MGIGEPIEILRFCFFSSPGTSFARTLQRRSMPMAAPLPVTSALTTEIAEWVTVEDSGFNGGIGIVVLLLSPSNYLLTLFLFDFSNVS